MSSKTDVSGRVKQKVMVIDEHGHDLKRVKVVKSKGGYELRWLCETCGGYVAKAGVGYKLFGGKK